MIYRTAPFFNDTKLPLFTVSRSRYSLTLNISETVRDADIVLMEYWGLTYALLNNVISNDLE